MLFFREGAFEITLGDSVLFSKLKVNYGYAHEDNLITKKVIVHIHNEYFLSFNTLDIFVDKSHAGT